MSFLDKSKIFRGRYGSLGVSLLRNFLAPLQTIFDFLVFDPRLTRPPPCPDVVRPSALPYPKFSSAHNACYVYSLCSVCYDANATFSLVSVQTHNALTEVD